MTSVVLLLSFESLCFEEIQGKFTKTVTLYNIMEKHASWMSSLQCACQKPT